MADKKAAADVVVIAVYAGDDSVLQTERGYRLRDALGFIPIDGQRASFRDRTKSAPARADIAQKHKGRGEMVPAFADVGALRRLTNRMKAKPASELLQVVEVLSHRCLGPQPRGFRLFYRRTHIYLNQLLRAGHVIFILQVRRRSCGVGRVIIMFAVLWLQRFPLAVVVMLT